MDNQLYIKVFMYNNKQLIVVRDKVGVVWFNRDNLLEFVGDSAVDLSSDDMSEIQPWSDFGNESTTICDYDHVLYVSEKLARTWMHKSLDPNIGEMRRWLEMKMLPAFYRMYYEDRAVAKKNVSEGIYAPSVAAWQQSTAAPPTLVQSTTSPMPRAAQMPTITTMTTTSTMTTMATMATVGNVGPSGVGPIYSTSQFARHRRSSHQPFYIPPTANSNEGHTSYAGSLLDLNAEMTAVKAAVNELAALVKQAHQASILNLDVGVKTRQDVCNLSQAFAGAKVTKTKSAVVDKDLLRVTEIYYGGLADGTTDVHIYKEVKCMENNLEKCRPSGMSFVYAFPKGSKDFVAVRNLLDILNVKQKTFTCKQSPEKVKRIILSVTKRQ